MFPHLFYWVVGCTGIIRNINRQCFLIKSIIDIVIAVVCTANCDIIGWSVIITYYISILIKGEIFIFMRSIYPFGVKLSMICRHTLFKSNYWLGYVKLKFFTTKIFCNSPKLFERRIFPEYPPPLCGIGVRPRLSFGDNHIIPAYCRISNLWL